MSKRGLSSNAIKLIAVAAMLIDHIAWRWFPLGGAPGFIMHTIGRITAPVMCYFIAEGYYRTRSVPRYALRLLIFAVISQVPFCYYLTGRFGFAPSFMYTSLSGMYNIFFTLLLGLLALHAMNSRRIPRVLRLLIAALCCAATYFSDWSFFGVLFILAFGARRDDFKRQTMLFIAVCAVKLVLQYKSGGWGYMFQAGVLLSLPILWLYNGKRSALAVGRPNTAVTDTVVKYAFYVFYPLHLLLIMFIWQAMHR